MDKIFPYDSNLVSYIIDASILIPIQPKSSGTKAKTQQKTTNSEKEPENKSQFSKSQQRQQVVLKYEQSRIDSSGENETSGNKS